MIEPKMGDSFLKKEWYKMRERDERTVRSEVSGTEQLEVAACPVLS
jgi:hypothetical protein